MQRIFAIILALSLSGCAGMMNTDDKAPVRLAPASFSDLPDWDVDQVAEALPALKRSCEKISSKHDFIGTEEDWKPVCAAVPENADDAAARNYFEQNFNVYRVFAKRKGKGLFTGYYEPDLQGADTPGTPLYARPPDLITVDLGQFRPELKGETIAGRVAGEKLIPYFDRAEIEAGALKDKGLEILHVKDPVDAFFLQVQGSGRVTMPDGTVRHVGYAAQNGHIYFAIGKALIDKGVLTKKTVSMQSIRDWLKNNPDQAQELMNKNKSYVFFRDIGAEGPLGAEGVALTSGRSLAVDHRHLAYGLPIFVDAEYPLLPSEEKTEQRLSRLMVTQDTGGAIRGAIRGDVFWGAGDEAAARAGVMKSKGRYWILLPKTVTVPKDRLKHGWF
jgi:membrane-bound lytic murein transglycosylase A